MEFRVFILSLACLCCLTPPALCSVHLLEADAAVGAAPGAALLGAKALAIKGAALLGAKALAIKGAAIGAVKLAAKGAAILAAKGAAVKGALALAAKASDFAVHDLPPVLVQPADIRYTVPTVVPADAVAIETSPPLLPPLLNSLTSLWSLSANHKINAVGNVLEALHPEPVIAAPILNTPVIYEVPDPAHFYPLLQRVEKDCL